MTDPGGTELELTSNKKRTTRGERAPLVTRMVLSPLEELVPSPSHLRADGSYGTLADLGRLVVGQPERLSQHKGGPTYGLE